MIHDTCEGADILESSEISAIKHTAFVLLPYQLDADKWEARHLGGEVPDKSPYGYHYAESAGFSVRLSRPRPDRHTLLRQLRRAGQKLLGFDFLHAWQQRDEIFASDIVWTHTEKEHLAVALLFMLTGKKCPELIAQSVWLFDDWNSFSRVRKYFYKRLLARADILTVLSHENLKIIEMFHLPVKAEVVKFGISLDSFPVLDAPLRQLRNPVHVLALGNDRDRDWPVFYEALKNRVGIEARVISSRFPSNLHADNLSILQASSLSDVKKCYEWADLVVVPLRENYHASGITVILEAIACGLPVIATDTGGLKGYFNDDEVSYVPPSDPDAILNAVRNFIVDDGKREQFVTRARTRMLRENYSSRNFAFRHRSISLELLGLSLPDSLP